MSLLTRRRAMMAQGSGMEHGTWEDLFYHIDKGDYAKAYAVGEIIPLDLGTQGIVNAQIVAFNADELADSTDKAHVTFITEHILTTGRRFNPGKTAGTEGTGVIGGWGKSEIRKRIQTYVAPQFPSDIYARILEVKKYSKAVDTSDAWVQNDLTTDMLWIPSARELYDSASYSESMGPRYSFMNNNDKRIKTKAGSTTAARWWTRSAYNTNESYRDCANNGRLSYISPCSQSSGVVIGFCV